MNKVMFHRRSPCIVWESYCRICNVKPSPIETRKSFFLALTLSVALLMIFFLLISNRKSSITSEGVCVWLSVSSLKHR